MIFNTAVRILLFAPILNLKLYPHRKCMSDQRT